jgi:hypothetical protein
MLWNCKIADLKDALDIPPSSATTRQQGVELVYARLKRSDDEDEEDEEGTAGGQTQTLPAASQVIMGHVLHSFFVLHHF